MRSEVTSSVSGDPLAGVRARGSLSVEAVLRGDRSVRADVHESGALRVRFPREHLQRLDATIVNVAGGMTGGDRFDVAFHAREGAQLFVSSAAAEKIYRSSSDATRIDVRLSARAGSLCAWLPQETIIFNQARLVRTLDAEIDPNARFIACEMTILGRAAMEESVDTLNWRERWRLRRAGRLVLAEDALIEGDATRMLAKRATGRGAHCFATLVYAGGDAEVLCSGMRERLDGAGGACEAGVSTFDDLVVARFAAMDGQSLRASVMTCLAAIEGVSLPRGWHT